MFTIAAFVEALTLEEVGTDRYRANSLSSTHGVVFGGQLLAQSVMAGLAGQDGKSVKTIHTVFARGASPDAPLEIAVERMHSGRSVASSTVTISQGDTLVTRSLILLSADEPDVIRHADTPRAMTSPEASGGTVRGEGVWEIVIVDDVDISDPELVGPPELDAWVRFVDAPDDPATDQALVAYSTDGFLIGTAMRPHAGVGQAQAHVTLSTGVLSHTLTYHERCPAAEWHYLQQRSSFAGNGRSYGHGDIFRRDGQLAASFVQDAMIRGRSGKAGAL
ncbi:MAG TPA: acyl-CoA thioesterase domain-containing protein [Acidimicrobiales bacterium]|jgi:acyl-CoA thioesterase|nr:acyl-CoA thioesterase domain-containing protein [Acidimicrobiales bacterium]